MSEKTYEDKTLGGIQAFKKTDTDYTIYYKTGETAKLWNLNNHVFKYYMSSTGVFQEYPTPHNPTDVAKINAKNIQEYGTEAFDNSFLKESEHSYTVHTEEIKIIFLKIEGTFIVHDKRVEKDILKERAPLCYSLEKTTQTLLQNNDEYYFAGGMQNGRFSHKGEIIHIENTNVWVDGGVTSPNPFYWSTYGYGVLRNTWQPGFYNFGTKNSEIIETLHKENYFDAFFFIGLRPRHILSDYYELTGQPILLPEFAFYEAHLNTFNRDYWVEVDRKVKGAILFEDGKYYKCYQPQDMDDKKGILESLNGEKNNYQFSARAMIDRYINNDMPLGWFIPNDGYGSGYGQTDSLEGDLENLKEFVKYANINGVEVGLWTESNLEPKDPKHPKKGERDLSQEVSMGAVTLKCDVAWIGDGYSYGLNAVEDATNIFNNRAKHSVRPFIIMVDGWAGTQRYAGIWSGDQTGGKWEYIRFHIPTYIGAGLSGLPIVGSDMDGIYGGEDKEVNIRDYQWKTFTPLQLNMDGWGSTPKTPFSFDQEAIAINRAYLKLKSMLLPYNYTIAHEALFGFPMVRAIFLEFPKDTPAYTKDSQYQYMWGPSLLVAPVYKKVELNENQLVRDGVFLPDPKQIWIDLFSGQKYQGGKIYNNLTSPLWKIPVFVRDGAIIPFVNANNNPKEINRNCRMFTIYPNGKTEFEVYEDDGKSSEYLQNQCAKTKITAIGPKSNRKGDLHVYIQKTEGQYKHMVTEKTTLLRIMTSQNIENIKAAINGATVDVQKTSSEEEFNQHKNNVYYYNEKFMINPYLKDLGTDEELFQKFLLIKLARSNVTKTEIQIKVTDYINDGKVFGSNDTINVNLKAPSYFTVFDEDITPTSIALQWTENEYASYYEIERDGVIFSNILGKSFKFEDFKYESEHSFRIRSADDGGVSKWSYYIIVKTEADPHKSVVTGVAVTCSTPCQPLQEVSKLTKRDVSSIWHTDWTKPWQADSESKKVIILKFNLENVYNIDRVEYVPREDAGNGTFLKIQYRHSIDKNTWSDFSPIINWEQDETPKTIKLNGIKMQFMELHVLESVGGFGSGKNILFYKKL